MKTFSNETSERYALALFELAAENSEVDEIEKNISQLLEICKKIRIFEFFKKSNSPNRGSN